MNDLWHYEPQNQEYLLKIKDVHAVIDPDGAVGDRPYWKAWGFASRWLGLGNRTIVIDGTADSIEEAKTAAEAAVAKIDKQVDSSLGS